VVRRPTGAAPARTVVELADKDEAGNYRHHRQGHRSVSTYHRSDYLSEHPIAARGGLGERGGRRQSLIPYVTAGFPDARVSAMCCVGRRARRRFRGVGVPFATLADGPPSSDDEAALERE